MLCTGRVNFSIRRERTSIWCVRRLCCVLVPELCKTPKPVIWPLTPCRKVGLPYPVSSAPCVDAPGMLHQAWSLILIMLGHTAKWAAHCCQLTTTSVPHKVLYTLTQCSEPAAWHGAPRQHCLWVLEAAFCMPGIRCARMTHHHDVCPVRAALLCSCRCRRPAGQVQALS